MKQFKLDVEWFLIIYGLLLIELVRYFLSKN